MKKILSVILSVLVFCCLCACQEPIAPPDPQNGSSAQSPQESSQLPESSSSAPESSDSHESSEPEPASSEVFSAPESSGEESAVSSEASSEAPQSSGNEESSDEPLHGGRVESSQSSAPEPSKPEEFGPIESEELQAAIRDLPGLYGHEYGSYGQGSDLEDDEEGEYIEIFYEFGRFYASVMYTMNQSVYSFAALELLPFDCRGSEMRFTAREYSMMSQWNKYVSVTSVIIEPTENGIRFTAEDEGGFFPQGVHEFQRTDLLGPKGFMYTLEDLKTFIYEGLEDVESSKALVGSWTAESGGTMVCLTLDEAGNMKMLIDDQDDFTPDRLFEGVYIAKEGPGSLSFYYLGNILGNGGMPSSGEDLVALLDGDTFSVIAVQDGYLPDGETVVFHRAP